ncbi:MAG: tRNA glutamyl-Q(34) synthetase GluQRS, partial [Treponema sp.]|nr:tRNA glutamyl-Q(34) synthetase GluQRS [Treponema sp.]
MVKGRFAPSPSGRMHLGNVYAALVSWLSAKKAGGSWLLRVEDLDRQRCKKEWADQLMDDLLWLGLEWNEGPYFQSQRDGIYQEYFGRLEAQGLVYDCFCSRADLMASSAPHLNGLPPVYAGTCRNISFEEREGLLRERKPAQRLRVDDRKSVFVDGH